MKKILQIIDSDGYGGVQQVARQIRGLVGSARIETYSYLSYEHKYKFLKWCFIFFGMFRKVFQKNDTVLIHAPFMLPFAFLFRLFGTRVVFCMHGPHRMRPYYFFDYLGMLRFLSILCVNDIVLVSAGQQKYLPGCMLDRSVVINNIPKTDYSEICCGEEIVLPVCYKYYFHVGRICFQKNQEFSIKIHSKIKEIDPLVKLVIVGSGSLDEERSLIEIATSMNLVIKRHAVCDSVDDIDFDILMIGPIKSFQALSGVGQLMIFPSRFEGYPLSIVEALLLGFRVISSDCDTGPSDILNILMSSNYIAGDLPITLIPAEFNEAGSFFWARLILSVLDKSKYSSIEGEKEMSYLLANEDKFYAEWGSILRIF